MKTGQDRCLRHQEAAGMDSQPPRAIRPREVVGRRSGLDGFSARREAARPATEDTPPLRRDARDSPSRFSDGAGHTSASSSGTAPSPLYRRASL